VQTVGEAAAHTRPAAAAAAAAAADAAAAAAAAVVGGGGCARPGKGGPEGRGIGSGSA